MKPPSKSKLDALDALARETTALHHRLRAVAERLHGDGPVTGAMHGVLQCLEQNGPQTVPQMARARPVSRQHIQTTVNSLRSQGLVELIENPAHKRSSLVQLTPAGVKSLERIKRKEETLLSQLPLPVSKKELRAAADSLRTVREVLEGPGWQRLIR